MNGTFLDSNLDAYRLVKVPSATGRFLSISGQRYNLVRKAV